MGAATSAAAEDARPDARPDAKPRRPRNGVRSLTDEAYAQLEELIVTLQLRPGVAV
jgi:DNA-binding GntR family transcriptional regulator